MSKFLIGKRYEYKGHTYEFKGIFKYIQGMNEAYRDVNGKYMFNGSYDTLFVPRKSLRYMVSTD